jgi:DNA helicase-2/ATP-dependent DNA helicase PcrA
VRRILEFPNRYPDAARVVLETNYRCPPAVVAAADRLISVNRERVPKRLRAAPRPHPPGGGRPLLTWPYRGPDAADRLATILPALAADGGRVAVLARTRAELGPVILALLRAGIPHATNVATPLDAEPVVALVDELRASDPTRPPVSRLLRQRAARGWGRGDPSDALGEDAHLALDAAVGWAVGHPRTASYLAAFDEARVRLAALRDPNAPIELATIHGTKGREWPVVVVIGMELDRFPNKRSLSDALDPARALEEERRLAYVAVTRCRDRLILAFDPDRPSPFVAELMGQPARDPTASYRPTSSATTSR